MISILSVTIWMMVIYSSFSIVLESIFDDQLFQFGPLYLTNSLINSSTTEKYRPFLAQCSNSIMNNDNLDLFLSKFRFSAHLTLHNDMLSRGNDYSEEDYFLLSILWNNCAALTTDRTLQEYLYQLSIFSSPQRNYAAYKNYAYLLECDGYAAVAKDLYHTCSRSTRDHGCAIHDCMVAPLLLYSTQTAQYHYLQSLRCLFVLVKSTASTSSTTTSASYSSPMEVYNVLRELPIMIQFLGYGTGYLQELLSISLMQPAMQPSMMQPSMMQPSMMQPTSTKAANIEQPPKVLRVGIISEHFGNSSPGLCIQRLLVYLATVNKQTEGSQYNQAEQGESGLDQIELIFFDRLHGTTVAATADNAADTTAERGLPTSFAAALRSVTTSVHYLPQENLTACIELISQQVAMQQIDVLLYLAGPTDKITYLLAHYRLAAVQIIFGLGHPFSPGIVGSAIDYVIVSSQMLREEEESAVSALDAVDPPDETVVDSLQCAYEAFVCEEELITVWWQSYLQQEQQLELIEQQQSMHPVQQSSSSGLFEVCQLSSACYQPAAISLYYQPSQVVHFDSLAHVIMQPLTFHAENKQAAWRTFKQALYNDSQLSCEELVALDEERLLPAVIQAVATAASSATLTDLASLNSPLGYLYCSTHSSDSQLLPPRYHFYFAVQFMKKFHPAFDLALLFIMLADKQAKIIVKQAVRDLLIERLYRCYVQQILPSLASLPFPSDASMLSLTRESISGHLFTVPASMPHEVYLTLLSLSSVFLNTYPVGAGMTSSEALALHTPVILYPAATTALQFALGQLRQLALPREIFNHMVVQLDGRLGDSDGSLLQGAWQYAQKAVALATEPALLREVSEAIALKKHLLFGNEQGDDSNDRVLEEVGEEWRAFLYRARNLASSS